MKSQTSGEGQESINAFDDVVTGFGEEWSRFDQSGAGAAELQEIFESYFAIFPWHRLPSGAVGIDIGCGSGRWAKMVAPKVGTLHCVDASAEALAVARRNLAGAENCAFHLASVDAMPLPDGQADFAYSLGVLHHVPDTEAALRSCAKKLKRGAPFLLYLYYRFDNRSRWFRSIWRASEMLRLSISRLPKVLRYAAADVLALSVYWPLARLAKVAERLGRNVDAFPLSAYRDRSLYVMRTNALDRFGTRVERRFTRVEIESMLLRAGFNDVAFSSNQPYWCAVSFKA